jgi:hypothetical protein
MADNEEPPGVDETSEKIDEAQKEAAEVERKLDDPHLNDAQRAEAEERLAGIEKRLDTLFEKMDALLKQPVAPSPRRAADDPPAPEPGHVVVPESGGQEPPADPPRTARYAKAWWGKRAYDD